MEIVLPVLGAAFAAFMIWLAVRVINQREHRAKWAAVLLAAALVTYPVSFGPACRFAGKLPFFETAYQPCIYLAIDGPLPIRVPLRWWVAECDGELNLLIIEVTRLMQQ